MMEAVIYLLIHVQRSAPCVACWARHFDSNCVGVHRPLCLAVGRRQGRELGFWGICGSALVLDSDWADYLEFFGIASSSIPLMDTSLVEKTLVFKSEWISHSCCISMQVLSVSPFKPCDPSLLANRANHALPGLSRAVPLWFLGALWGWAHQWGLYFNSCLQQRKHEKALGLIHACFCDQWILHSQEVQASTGLRRHWPLCLRRLSLFMAWIAQCQAFTTS